MLHTVVITIGRNVGDKPMESMPWATFINDVELALIRLNAHVISRPIKGDDQQGIWGETREAGAVFVAFVHEQQLLKLEISLMRIKGNYGQEAIGLITREGTGHVV